MDPTIPTYTPPFLRLPIELHQEIASYLFDDTISDGEIASHTLNGCMQKEDTGPQEFYKENFDVAALSLRLTNRYFHDILPVPTHDMLLRLERRGDVGYACKFCIRLRPAYEFDERMLKKKRRLFGSESRLRFCADCGFEKKGGYTPGTSVVIGGVKRVLCVVCKEVKSEEEADGNPCPHICKTCIQKWACNSCTHNKRVHPKAKKQPEPSALDYPRWRFSPLRFTTEPRRYRNPFDTERDEGEEEEEDWMPDYMCDDDDWRF